MPAYDDDARRRAARPRRARPSPGDPEATGAAILELVDADEPPLRVFFGTFPLAVAQRAYADRLATWRAWQSVSERAQGDAAVTS